MLHARPDITFLLALLMPPAGDLSCAFQSESFTSNQGIQVTGIVRFVRVEGGCWRLEAQNGTHYELRARQAPSRVLVDGARVVLTVRPRVDLMSTCQVGKIVDVEQVESVEAPAP